MTLGFGRHWVVTANKTGTQLLVSIIIILIAAPSFGGSLLAPTNLRS